MKWTPHKFHKNNEDQGYYDPTDAMVNTSNYPAVLNHTSIKLDNLGENDHSYDQECHNDRFDMTKMTLPIIEIYVLALATWYRVIYSQIDHQRMVIIGKHYLESDLYLFKFFWPWTVL